jgi:hypothetical protein
MLRVLKMKLKKTNCKIPVPILYYYRVWKKAEPQCNYPELFTPNEPCGWFVDWPIQGLELELSKLTGELK